MNFNSLNILIHQLRCKLHHYKTIMNLHTVIFPGLILCQWQLSINSSCFFLSASIWSIVPYYLWSWDLTHYASHKTYLFRTTLLKELINTIVNHISYNINTAPRFPQEQCTINRSQLFLYREVPGSVGMIPSASEPDQCLNGSYNVSIFFYHFIFQSWSRCTLP